MDQVDVTRQMVRTLLAADGFVPTHVEETRLSSGHVEYWQKGEYLCELPQKGFTVVLTSPSGKPRGIGESGIRTMHLHLPQDLNKVFAWIKEGA